MVSTHFANLEACLAELKRIYLDVAMAAPSPTDEQQEMARAFVVFAHAEFEAYLEKAFGELAQCVMSNASAGRYSAASLALLTFSGLEPLTGGDTLDGSKKAKSRSLPTRLGDAKGKLLKIIDDNTGVREKYLAKMAVPLGFDSRCVDSTWLSDLETFCSWRGAYAHMSRADGLASHLAVNPTDVWLKCESLTWDSAIATQGLVSSFQGLDAWIESEKNTFGQVITIAPAQQPWLLRQVWKIKARLVS